MSFVLKSPFSLSGDQPKAVEQLVSGLKKGYDKQTLLGVTGSGKTFTIANVIDRVQTPTLVIVHNKTLAAQLCNEFREFFPQNAVEYFVSYYDYYQPEAYMPHTDTYIEKEAQINEEIDRLRHACTQALLTRRDVIIVASVSAIYGLGSPQEYLNVVLRLNKGEKLDRPLFLKRLVEMHFERTTSDLKRGTFRLRGRVLEIMPVNEEAIYRLEGEGVLERMEKIDPITRKVVREENEIWLFPAKHYIAGEEARIKAAALIKAELKESLAALEKKGKLLESERLRRRVNYDLEMIKNIGYCNGIENYSRHFDGRAEGEPPFTLLDYFSRAPGGGDFLMVIDESHVTVPQLGGMYNGDRARKNTLVDYGFRLPSARDNRPLRFAEFEKKCRQTVYVSATPGDYELKYSRQVVEQIVRPTGLVDPEVVIRPITGKDKEKSQVEDLILRLKEKIAKKERALVTALTKRHAEDLSDYLRQQGFKVRYLHSEVDTLERIEVITELRKGDLDVVVGVNLLREGLDIPEVSLVAILDADKEGFLRDQTSLIQTIGRAARNVNGQVILYADRVTGSIERAMKETDRRRLIQIAYNKKHKITPRTIQKNIRNILEDFGIAPQSIKNKKKGLKKGKDAFESEIAADSRPLEEIIKEKETQMKKAAKDLQFELAAVLRDELRLLRSQKPKTKG